MPFGQNPLQFEPQTSVGTVSTTITTPNNAQPVSLVDRVQSQIKQQRPTRITQPGYEVYFYSRFGGGGKNPWGSNLTPATYSGSPGTSTGVTTMKNVTPDIFFNSKMYDFNNASAPGVYSITVNTRVNNQQGSDASIRIIQPEGIEYFKPTMGYSPAKQPDYDTPNTHPGGTERIGVMDTVVIKLINKPQYGDTLRETVFRGVVKQIRRTKNPTGGTWIDLDLMDFTEWLIQLYAIPIGWFTTIAFNITGRGIAAQLLRYANQLYTGKWSPLGVPLAVAQNAAAKIAKIIDQALNTTFLEDIKLQSHAMDIPPLLWMENAQLINKGIPDDAFMGQGTIQNLLNTVVFKPDGSVNNAGTILSNAKTFVANIGSQIWTAAQSIWSGQFSNVVSAEDVESLTTYQRWATTTNLQSELNRSIVNQAPVGAGVKNNLQQIAWILSDVNLPLIFEFGHKQVWQTIYDFASRSMREAYFDFAPKIAGEPQCIYDTATVPEIKAYGAQLDDIHPNIGILKYRLSPCFIPYDASKDFNSKTSNTNTSTQFRFFSISDDDMLLTEATEDEGGVFTAVLAFGSSIDPETIADDALKVLLLSQGNVLSFAQSIDTDIERRIGYRFMSNHDNNIAIPLLNYLLGYIQLERSQLNMFNQTITILGNPYIQPGSIVRIESQHVDYYCSGVMHSWNLQSGYQTILTLQYGHSTGRPPSGARGGSNPNVLSQTQAAQCHLDLTPLNSLGISSTLTVGNVNELCLVSTLWKFMTCGTREDAVLTGLRPEAAKGAQLKCGGPASTLGIPKWPFPVYGPLGIQATTNDLQNALCKFQTGMPLSIKYISALLKKYKDSTTQMGSPNAAFAGINQSDTFEKVVAAWFTDDGSQTQFDPATLSLVITSLRKLYDDCKNCLATPVSEFQANTDAEVMAATKGLKMVNPLTGTLDSGDVTLVSTFGNPNNQGRKHDGIDLAHPGDDTGKPIYAAAAGRIISTQSIGESGGYGNLTIIDCGNGITMYYAHQSQFLVSNGQNVAVGHEIGLEGNTGESFGAHLHFEIRENGNPRNPIPILSQNGVNI